MKKSLFFILLTLCSLLFVPCSIGQGNLQFNQVITYSQTYTGTYVALNTYSFNSSSFIVPSNKVWKVEKFSISGGLSNEQKLIVNSVHGIPVSDVNSGPVWLKSGDNLKAYSACSGCGSLAGTFFLSIIEFNVIP